jgi:hypothetical protein
MEKATKNIMTNDRELSICLGRDRGREVIVTYGMSASRSKRLRRIQALPADSHHCVYALV